MHSKRLHNNFLPRAPLVENTYLSALPALMEGTVTELRDHMEHHFSSPQSACRMYEFVNTYVSAVQSKPQKTCIYSYPEVYTEFWIAHTRTLGEGLRFFNTLNRVHHEHQWKKNRQTPNDCFGLIVILGKPDQTYFVAPKGQGRGVTSRKFNFLDKASFINHLMICNPRDFWKMITIANRDYIENFRMYTKIDAPINIISWDPSLESPVAHDPLLTSMDRMAIETIALQQVQGDGHCLIRALACSMGVSYEVLLSRLERENLKDPTGTLDIDGYLYDKKWDTERNNDMCSIIAKAMEINIVVLKHEKATDKQWTMITLIGSADDKVPVHVLHYTQKHFQAAYIMSFVDVDDNNPFTAGDYSFGTDKPMDSDSTSTFTTDGTSTVAPSMTTVLGGLDLSAAQTMLMKQLQAYFSDVDKVKIAQLTTAVLSASTAFVGVLLNLIAGDYGSKLKWANVTLWAINCASSIANLCLSLKIWEKLDTMRESLIVQAIVTAFREYGITQADKPADNTKLITTSVKLVTTMGLGILGFTNPAVYKKIHSLPSAAADVSATYALVAASLYDIAGIDIDGSHEFELVLKEMQEQAEKWLSTPTDQLTKANLNEMEKLLRDISDVTNKARKTDKIALLTGHHAKLLDYYTAAKASYHQRKPTPAPVAYFWHGDPGHGKSEFVKTNLSNHLTKRLSVPEEAGQVYSLNITAGKHFPQYTGQTWAVFDELGNTKSNSDTSLATGGLLNEIISAGGANIPGASLSAKSQKTSFYGVHFISNQAPETVDVGLLPQGKAAWMSRLTVIRVVDPKYNPNAPRNHQPHRKSDFSHLEFYVGKEKKPRTASAIRQMIEDQIVQNVTRFRERTEKADNELKNVTPRPNFTLLGEVLEAGGFKCISVSGKPGVGKTYDFSNDFGRYTQALNKQIVWMRRGSGHTFCVQKDTIYIFDDYFDFTTKTGQDEMAMIFDVLPISSQMVVISNFLPDVYSWRCFMSGCTKVRELRDGFFRRMGWMKGNLAAKSYCKENQTYVEFHTGAVKHLDAIVSDLFITDSQAHFHLGEMPAQVTVTKANADLYFHMPVPAQQTMAQVFAIMRQNCKSPKLAHFLLRHVKDIDVHASEIDNFTKICSKYYKEIKDFKVLIQAGKRICLLQDGEFYVNQRSMPWTVIREGVDYYHYKQSEDKKVLVDIEAFRSFRNGRPASSQDEIAQFIRFSEYATGDLQAYELLDTIPRTWTEFTEIWLARMKKATGGLAAFCRRHWKLLAALTGLSTAAVIIAKLAGILELGQSFEQQQEEAFKHKEKDHAANALEKHEIYKEILQMVPEDKRKDFLHKTGIPAFMLEKGRAGGKSFAHTVARRSIKIGGKWYYDDEIEDDYIQEFLRRAAEHVQKKGAYLDKFGRAHSNFEFEGENYHIMITHGQANIIIEPTECVPEKGENPRSTFEGIFESNVVHLSCLTCVHFSHATMLDAHIGIAPRHVFCSHNTMRVTDWKEDSIGEAQRLIDDIASETTLFAVLNSKTRKPMAVPGAKDITGQIPTSSILNSFTTATIVTRRGQNFHSYTGPYAYHETFVNESMDSQINEWRLRAGVMIISVANQPAHSLHATQAGDCGVPYFAVDSSRKIYFVGFHTMWKSCGQHWGIVLTQQTLARMLDKLRKMPIVEKGGYELNYETVTAFHPHRAPTLVEASIHALMRAAVQAPNHLDPIGPALEKVAVIEHSIPYDPATKRETFDPAIDTNLIGEPRHPAMDEAEVLIKCPEKIPNDKNGNKHLAYVRLSQGEWNLSTDDDSQLREHAMMAAIALAAHDEIQYNIKDPVPLTPKTVLNGRKGQEPMKLKQKSAGAISQILHNCPYKIDYFIENELGEIDYADTPSGRWLKSAVRDQHWAAVRGIRIAYPTHVTLKPELLHIEKLWKKRVVQNSFLTTLINMKRFCQPLAEQFNRGGAKTPYALAIAPRVDWHTLVSDLLEHGSQFLDLDFSSFDLTVPDFMIKAAFKYIAYFYRNHPDSEGIANALSVYADNVSYDPILVGKSLITKQGGIASGIESTSFIDSIVCRLTLYLILSKVKTGITKPIPVEKFTSWVRSKNCGDDFLIVFADGTFVPFSVIKKHYKELFGMKCTNGSKTEEESDEPASIYEVQFCSRTTEMLPDSPFFWSKLKPEAVAGALTYTKTKDKVEQFNQLRAGLLEVLPYGDKVYSSIARQVRRFAKEHRIPIEIETWETLRAQCVEEIKDSISTHTVGMRQRDLGEQNSFYVPDFLPFSKEDFTLPTHAELTKILTTDMEISPTIATAKALMNKWRKDYLNEGGVPVRHMLEYPGAKEVLCIDGPAQEVTLGGIKYNIPTRWSISGFQYVLCLKREGKAFDVKSVAETHIPNLPAGKADLVDYCRMLEQIKDTSYADRNFIPAKNDVDFALTQLPQNQPEGFLNPKPLDLTATFNAEGQGPSKHIEVDKDLQGLIQCHAHIVRRYQAKALRGSTYHPREVLGFPAADQLYQNLPTMEEEHVFHDGDRKYVLPKLHHWTAWQFVLGYGLGIWEVDVRRFIQDANEDWPIEQQRAAPRYQGLIDLRMSNKRVLGAEETAHVNRGLCAVRTNIPESGYGNLYEYIFEQLSEDSPSRRMYYKRLYRDLREKAKESHLTIPFILEHPYTQALRCMSSRYYKIDIPNGGMLKNHMIPEKGSVSALEYVLGEYTKHYYWGIEYAAVQPTDNDDPEREEVLAWARKLSHYRAAYSVAPKATQKEMLQDTDFMQWTPANNVPESAQGPSSISFQADSQGNAKPVQSMGEGTSVDAPETAPPQTQMILSEAVANAPTAAALTGVVGSGAAGAMVLNAGIDTSEDITQVAIIEDMKTFAFKNQWVATHNLNTETEAGTVITRIKFDPFSPNLLHRDAHDWAKHHKRFNGTIKFSFRLTTTPGLYGEIGAAFLPPQYADDITAINEANLSRFKIGAVSLSQEGTFAYELRGINPTDSKLLFIEKDTERNYGELVIFITVRTANIYGTVVPMTLRQYCQLGQDSYYFDKDFSVDEGQGGDLPALLAPPGSSLLADGRAARIDADGTELVAPTPLGPDAKIGFLLHGGDNINTQLNPIVNATATYCYTNPSAVRPREAQVGGTPPVYGHPDGWRLGIPTNYPHDTPNKEEYGLYGNTMKMGNWGAPVQNTGYGGYQYDSPLESETVPSIWYDGLNPSPTNGWDFTKSSYQIDKNDPDSAWTYGDIGYTVTPVTAATLKIQHYGYTDITDPGRRLPIWSAFFGTMATYDGPTDGRPHKAAIPDSGLTYNMTGAYYCSNSSQTNEVLGLPSGWARMVVVGPDDAIPAVLSGVSGATVVESYTQAVNELFRQTYFKNNTDVASITYTAADGSGAPIGTFVVNSYGMFANMDSNVYAIVNLDASDIRFTLQAKNTVPWPSLSELEPTAYTNRIITSNGAISRWEGEWQTGIPAELIGTLPHVVQKGGVPAFLNPKKKVKPGKCVPEASVAAGVVGGMVQGIGSGIGAAVQREHEKEMQARTFKAAGMLQQLKGQQAIEQIQAKLGSSALKVSTQSGVTNRVAYSERNKPTHEGDTLNFNRSDPLRQARRGGSQPANSQPTNGGNNAANTVSVDNVTVDTTAA